MDKITKFLKKLSKKEQKTLGYIVDQVSRGDISGLDVKKLKGEKNIFRVRQGNLRLIFLRIKDEVRVISVGRRNDNTYNKIR